MRILVSLCNRRFERCEENRRIFLLHVDTCSRSVRTISLPHEVTRDSLGMTGLTTYPGGYICVVSPGYLLYISKQLEVQHIYRLTLVRDGHSVIYRDEKCYIVSTGNDSIVEFSPEAGESVFWHANGSHADTIHLNSLLWDDAGFWVSAFGPKGGLLWSTADRGYILNILTGDRLMENLYHPHSLAHAHGVQYFCESSRRRVLSTAGDEVFLPHGYLRGLIVDDGCMLVGVTKGRHRSKSTGAIIDNPADPGTPSCQTGIVVLRRSGVSGSFEERDYIDLGAHANEIYDIVVAQ
jgi:hypothetical protein